MSGQHACGASVWYTGEEGGKHDENTRRLTLIAICALGILPGLGADQPPAKPLRLEISLAELVRGCSARHR